MNSAMKAAMSTLLKKYLLTRSNYINWLQNVRIVLRIENLLHILDDSIPSVPSDEAPQEERDAFDKYMSQQAQVQGILLAFMSCELQSQHKDMESQDIIMHLRELYGQ